MVLAAAPDVPRLQSLSQLATAFVFLFGTGLCQNAKAQDITAADLKTPAVEKQPKTGAVPANRNSKISGRVMLPDGKPAIGLVVCAQGIGAQRTTNRISGSTGADGSYELLVEGERAYMVGVIDARWAAPARANLIAHDNQSVGGIDFTLAGGTLIRGTVTNEIDQQPLAGRIVVVEQPGGPLPEELDVPHPGYGAPPVRFVLTTNTNDNGQYQFRVGPGSWQISAHDSRNLTRSQKSNLSISNEREIVIDIGLMPIPTTAGFSGKAIDLDDRPLAGGQIEGCYLNATGAMPPIRANIATDGTFKLGQ